MLYVARRSEGDETFSATKLNKLLFFADFTAYGQLGKLITGQQYQKLAFGPAPRGLVPARTKMLAAHDCALQRVTYRGREQERLVAVREPDLSAFTGQEIAIVDAILRRYEGVSATDISDMSHEFLGYKLARDREIIPPFTVFLDMRPLTEAERRHALTLP